MVAAVEKTPTYPSTVQETLDVQDHDPFVIIQQSGLLCYPELFLKVSSSMYMY